MHLADWLLKFMFFLNCVEGPDNTQRYKTLAKLYILFSCVQKFSFVSKIQIQRGETSQRSDVQITWQCDIWGGGNERFVSHACTKTCVGCPGNVMQNKNFVWYVCVGREVRMCGSAIYDSAESYLQDTVLRKWSTIDETCPSGRLHVCWSRLVDGSQAESPERKTQMRIWCGEKCAWMFTWFLTPTDEWVQERQADECLQVCFCPPQICPEHVFFRNTGIFIFWDHLGRNLRLQNWCGRFWTLVPDSSGCWSKNPTGLTKACCLFVNIQMLLPVSLTQNPTFYKWSGNPFFLLINCTRWRQSQAWG